MAKKKPGSPILEELRVACLDERTAVEFMEQHRWNGAPCCPRCGDFDVYTMKDRKTGGRNRDYRWRCRGCKRQFTVRTGTVMEETRLPIRAWCFAFWKACSSKKGVSAMQIHRETEISYKSALFLMHRIRHAMGHSDTTKLGGTVEADETYVGGKPRNPERGKPGRKPADKTKKIPVIGIVERGGPARLRAMERVTGPALRSALREHVDRTSRLVTDDSPFYKSAGTDYTGGHETTNHRRGEYVRKSDPTVHSNTAECMFSLLKRGVYGTFHSFSKKHMPKYLNEFEFRWNTRYNNDGERVAKAVWAANGKRLTYRDHVGSQR